jgi:integrase
MNSKPTRAQRIGHAMVVSMTAHGTTKANATAGENPIRSVITEGHYKFSLRRYLRWRSFMGLSLKGPYEASESCEFLDELADSLEQKQLDSERQALERVLKQQLPRIESRRETILTSRAYRLAEVKEIVKLQSDHNALCTTLCFVCGLRDHEPLTLRRADELERAGYRSWSPELFEGTGDCVVYTVKGKGGLLRSVAVPRDLAQQLEQRRLPNLAWVTDRKVHYEVAYAVGGGQAFSQSFCEASKKVLGFSMGAHGLRHSYAQRRIRTLRELGFSVNKALKIVSEELGHFRISVVWAYLR